MKKIILFLFTIVITLSGFAQEPADALRYSWVVPSGTARQQAIGGAMGSLGGDLSATFVNPAGLGFYKTGDLVFTPRFTFGKNESNYFGNKERDHNSQFNFSTSGFVVGGSNDDKKLKSAAFSLAFNRVADFNSNIFYRGVNNQSSYSYKFLEEIKNAHTGDGNYVSSNFPFGTSLALNTYWIDTIGGSTNGNFQFQTHAPVASGLTQQQIINSTGGITEFALGVGVNLNDKLMLGGSIGVPVLRYERTTEFLEGDVTDNHNNKFEDAIFSDKLSTRGTGLNLKAGLIYKPQEFWRLGLAFHSPTIYQLTDSYEANITTNTEGYHGTLFQNSKDLTNNQPSEFKYYLLTPYRVIGSVSYVFRENQDVRKQRGFLTADIEYVNYKASSFFNDSENNSDQDSKDYLKTLTKAISNYYKGAFNFRVGGELKFTTIMFRAGAAYYSNPYKDTYGEHGSKLNLSGGLGYRNKGFFIDLTYIHSINNDVNLAYRLQNAQNFGAAIRSTNGTALASVGFKF